MATETNGLELYFEWYLNDLKEAGFIRSFKREAFPILITEKATKKRYDFKAKTKAPKIEDFTLFNQNTYTFDYLIVWEKHAHELFYNLIETEIVRVWCPFYAMEDKDGNHVSFIDVKPPAGAMSFGNNTTGYTFPIIQKMIYAVYGIYISKAIPVPLVKKGEIKSGNKQALFSTTFVPKRYMFTDAGGQARKISYRKQSLQQYVSYRTKEIDRINALFSVQTTLL
jgi:hypothetical protein